MDFVLGLLRDTLLYVLNTLIHNSPSLIAGILVAAAIQVYVDPEKMKNWLMKRCSVSIPATVAFGAFTPLCACGTMAVVISMLATSLPWGPIMAFLTSSPLMSPEEFIMISGIISPAFAIALVTASVIIGLGAGYATYIIEKKTHFLDNQIRFNSRMAVPANSGCGCGEQIGTAETPALANTYCCSAPEEEDECGCEGESEVAVEYCGCGALALEPPVVKVQPVGAFLAKYKIDKLFKATFNVGIKRILPLFALFAGIGFLINSLIPTIWIYALFGAQNIFAVPLAALVGLPLYVNGDSSIPLIQSLMHSGVSGGSMLAFMITGPGTSAGVIAGITTIMKKKAVGLYIAYLLAGAILLGYAYDLILPLVGR